MSNSWNEKLRTNGPMRNSRDLVRLQKPVIKRRGNSVTTCFFNKETGQCFQNNCYWKANGICKKFPKEE